ncbi:MAG TPA: cysteine desulfurase family protein [Hyphomicrobiaceae bacterium]|jgi:cysteine desulfurase|nr:cysteine desulfurase family protein [Hyphomicrobiaceae bacterium]
MSGPRTYLDWNATAPLRPEARAAMLAALDCVGNASSPHAEGRRARALMEDAREHIAGCLGADPRRVYFTSGATEAANWLLTPNRGGGASKAAFDLLLVGASEHACVLEGHRFPAGRVERIPVDGDGIVDLAWLERRLAAAVAQQGAGTTLVALQAANNETGVLQPLASIAGLLAAAQAIWVCDAVQAVGRIVLDVKAIGRGALFLSGHKLGGPKGVGAVVFASDDLSPEPLLRGGGQERRQRSGTENVAAIAGLAAALAAALSEQDEVAARSQHLQRRFEAGLRSLSSEAVIFGDAVPRLANTTCFALPGIGAETALIALDLEGVAVSAGSACSSGKVARSHVLEAMQAAPALRTSALRVSSGRASSEVEIDACLAALRRLAEGQAKRHLQSVKARDRKVA